jgi:hypothetical protein
VRRDTFPSQQFIPFFQILIQLARQDYRETPGHCLRDGPQIFSTGTTKPGIIAILLGTLRTVHRVLEQPSSIETEHGSQSAD